MWGLTLNAMVFKHGQYPNAAKAFLQFMMEKEQYEPWLNANCGYWSQPLAAYADAAVWYGDPKVTIFKDTMKSTYYDGYKGPISTATGAVNADYVLVQMFASVATGRRRRRPRQRKPSAAPSVISAVRKGTTVIAGGCESEADPDAQLLHGEIWIRLRRCTPRNDV